MGMLTQLEIDYELDIVDDFVWHFGAMVDSMEALIVKLQDKNIYKTGVNDLFRIFHNIKSAASFVHLDPILNLAALVEEVLEEARELKGPASDELIDWLLLVSDQFNTYKSDLDQDAEYFSMLNPLIIKIPKNLQKF